MATGGLFVGSVYATMELQTGGFAGDIAAAQKALQQFDNGIGAAAKSSQGWATAAHDQFSSIGAGLTNLATRMVVVAGAGAALGGVFVKSAADLQQTSKSFEVLTGSAETAQKMFGQLAAYANTTPFEFPDIAKAGQTLLGFGIKAEDVFGHIKVLGDVAAATGADFGALSLVFAQVNATGKLMGQDALQLINNKIPIFNILGKEMGITAGEVKKKMEEGAIGTDVFNRAITNATKEGGFAFKGVDTLAASFNGRMSTLKDTVLEFGRNLIGVKVDPKLGLVIQKGGIFDQLSDTIPKITAGLADLAPKFIAAFDWIRANGGTILSVLAAFVAMLVTAKIGAFVSGIAIAGVNFLVMTGAMSSATAAQWGFNAAASANPIGAIVTGVIALVGVLVFLETKFGLVSTAIGWLKDTAIAGFAAFNSAAEGALAWIKKHEDAIKNVAIVLGVIFGPALLKAGTQAVISFAQMATSATVNGAKSSAAWIAASVKTGASWVAQFAIMTARAVATGVVMTVQAAAAGYQWLLAGAKIVLVNGYMLAVRTATLAWTAAQWLLNVALNANPIGLIVGLIVLLVAGFVALWTQSETFRNIVTGAFSAVWAGIQAVWNWVSANWPLLLAILTGPIGIAVLLITRNWDTIKAGFGAAVDFIKGIWSSITGFFGGVAAGIGNIFSNVVNGIRQKFNDVVNFVRGIPGSIMGAIGGMGSLLYNSGRDLLNGLVNGAKSILSNIGKFFLDAVPGWIKEPFKKALGINSPSKVFAGYGVNTAQGYIGGVESMQSAMQRTMFAASDAITNSFDPMMSGRAGTFDYSRATVGDGAGGGNSSSMVQMYGNINIASDADGDRFLTNAGLMREGQLVEKGMSV